MGKPQKSVRSQQRQFGCMQRRKMLLMTYATIFVAEMRNVELQPRMGKLKKKERSQLSSMRCSEMSRLTQTVRNVV